MAGRFRYGLSRLPAVINRLFDEVAAERIGVFVSETHSVHFIGADLACSGNKAGDQVKIRNLEFQIIAYRIPGDFLV